MKTFKLFAIVLIATLFACEKDEFESFNLNQDVAFQFEYTNYAWGMQHYGFLITNDGSIYEFDNPENWIFSEDNSISSEDFNHNLNLCVKLDEKISSEKMIEIKGMLGKFDKYSLTEPSNVMADAGSENYSFYLKNEGTSTYHNFLLLNRGDIFQKNTDSDAASIADWLIELNDGGVFDQEHFN